MNWGDPRPQRRLCHAIVEELINLEAIPLAPGPRVHPHPSGASHSLLRVIAPDVGLA
jgi:hypothetical protein